MAAILGVDISENNHAVDFTALKAVGVEFVLIRCGYGSDQTDQDDSRFFENVKKAKAYGMPYGVYLYSYALSTEDARSEARHALRLLRQVNKPAYGVWFDMEDADHYKEKHGMPSDSTLRTICEMFCVMLQDAGYYAGIYAALSWLNGPLSGPQLDKYDKWVAQWNSICDYRKPYGIWQYTDRKIIGGKKFDANYAYKDYTALTKGEDDMTAEEVKKIAQEEYNRLNPTYNTLDEVPSYWREDIKALLDNGIISGTGGGKLGLTRSEAKGAVIVWRAIKAAGDNQ